MVLNIPPFEGQLEWFKEWKWRPGQKIIFISSTSVYGNQNGEMLETIDDLPPSLLIEQERWIRANFEHWCILRFAGLVGNARHPGKILSGKTDLKGQDSPVNLLHLEDAIGFTQTVLERNLWYEIFNVCSDEHSFKKEFYTEFAERENLPLPMFDESDRSSGKLINNQKMKSHYQLTKAFL